MSETLNLFSIIKKYKPMLRESSIKNYLLSVMKLKKIYEIDGYSDFVRKPKTIIKQLHKLKLSKNTEKNYTSAIINVIDALNRDNIHGFTTKRFDNSIKTYRKHIFDLKGMIDEEFKARDGAMTEKEKKNYITLEDIGKVHKVYDTIVKQGDLLNSTELTSIERDTLQKWVLTALYAYLPPVRNEYATLNIVDRNYVKVNGIWKWTSYWNKMERNENYIVFFQRNAGSNMKINDGAIDIQMNQYKTSAKHGSRTLRIYEEGRVKYMEKAEDLLGPNKDIEHLWKVLWAWKDLNPTAKHIFMNKKGKQMTRNDMTKYLNRTFKILFPNKNISSNILRKSYHSSKEKANPIKKQYKKSKIIAESMGHTIDEAINTYTKDESK
tara:strand:- start:1551 stop:2690 length:1140 start_codon:yes stop_codon:yes gene_type:complete